MNKQDNIVTITVPIQNEPKTPPQKPMIHVVTNPTKEYIDQWVGEYGEDGLSILAVYDTTPIESLDKVKDYNYLKGFKYRNVVTPHWVSSSYEMVLTLQGLQDLVERGWYSCVINNEE